MDLKRAVWIVLTLAILGPIIVALILYLVLMLPGDFSYSVS